MILRGFDESAHIFGKAGAAEARSRMQEFTANAVVETDAARDFLDIGANFFAQIRNFVDEGDFGREKCIGCIFNEFCRAAGSCKE